MLRHGWLMQWHTSSSAEQGTELKGGKQSVWLQAMTISEVPW